MGTQYHELKSYCIQWKFVVCFFGWPTCRKRTYNLNCIKKVGSWLSLSLTKDYSGTKDVFLDWHLNPLLSSRWRQSYWVASQEWSAIWMIIWSQRLFKSYMMKGLSFEETEWIWRVLQQGGMHNFSTENFVPWTRNIQSRNKTIFREAVGAVGGNSIYKCSRAEDCSRSFWILRKIYSELRYNPWTAIELASKRELSVKAQ